MANATIANPENVLLWTKFSNWDFRFLKDMHYILIGLISAHRVINVQSDFFDGYYNAVYALSNICTPNPEIYLNQLLTGSTLITATILHGAIGTLKIPIDSISTSHIFLSACLNTDITDPIKFTTELITGYALYTMSTMTAIINPMLVIGFMIGYGLTDSKTKELYIKFLRNRVEKKVEYVAKVAEYIHSSLTANFKDEEIITLLDQNQQPENNIIIGETDFDISVN